MLSPITFRDLRGFDQVEPSVTSLIEVQVSEAVPPAGPPNDLIIMGTFRSGKPQVVKRFRTISALRNVHDPDRNGDVGVELATVARAGFADEGVNGAADLLTIRVDKATNSFTHLRAAVDLLKIEHADYGVQTNRARATVAQGSDDELATYKKLTLKDDVRTFVGDNLGVLMSLVYGGNAAAALLSIVNTVGKVTYTGQPTDEDKLEVNGVVFEFDDDDAVAEGSITVTIGADADTTFSTLVTAIQANVPGVTSVTIDTADNEVTVTATEMGVALSEVTDSGGVFGVSHSFPSARFLVELGGVITYTGQPADTETITINDVVFEWDNDDNVTAPNVPVAIGGDMDTTYASLVAAIKLNVPNVVVRHNTTANTVTVASATVAVSIAEASANVTTTTGQTDGGFGLDIPLTLTAYKSLDKLADYINAQIGFTAIINKHANPFIPASGLDPVSAQSILAAQNLTGYNAAIADFVNTKTRGNYTATEVARGEPDEETLQFAGGSTPIVTSADWEDAFTVVGAEVERGGILLIDSDDPAIMAMAVSFIEEQRNKGKWFRAYVGLEPALTDQQALDIIGGLDHSDVTATMQRCGIFGNDGTVEYKHPVYYAAALAGGAAGNLPYVNPLTNKRLRFAGLHDDDSFDEVRRARLLNGGITIAKREQDRTMVSLHVTTSRDPDRRMVRIASEIATVRYIDFSMREGMLQFRGKWASNDLVARAMGVGAQILNRFVTEGAISRGKDQFNADVEAWRWLKNAVYEKGVLALFYQVRIPGELDHISLHGQAEYQRLVGEVSGSVVSLETVVPIR